MAACVIHLRSQRQTVPEAHWPTNLEGSLIYWLVRNVAVSSKVRKIVKHLTLAPGFHVDQHSCTHAFAYTHKETHCRVLCHSCLFPVFMFTVKDTQGLGQMAVHKPGRSPHQNQPCWSPGLGQAASRRIRKCTLCTSHCLLLLCHAAKAGCE